MKKPLPLILLIFIIFLSGCSTIPQERFPSGLMGMIYDDFNNPVDAVQIQLTFDQSFSSDIDGRFLLPDLQKETYTITVAKEGYESQTITFLFNDPKQVLYIKMTSLKYLKNEIENRMQKREWAECSSLIDRAKAIDEDDPVLLYLIAVYQYRTGNPGESERILTQLKNSGFHYRGIEELYGLLTEKQEGNETGN